MPGGSKKGGGLKTKKSAFYLKSGNKASYSDLQVEKASPAKTPAFLAPIFAWLGGGAGGTAATSAIAAGGTAAAGEAAAIAAGKTVATKAAANVGASVAGSKLLAKNKKKAQPIMEGRQKEIM